MGNLSTQEYLQWQYRDSSNLSARAGLHVRFSTEEYPWFQWVFDRFDIPDNGRVLELGCGTGLLWRENLGRIPRSWTVTLSDASQGMLQEAEQNLLHTDLNLAFRKVDAQSIPYEKDSFDAVVANHMLYHVPRPGPGALRDSPSAAAGRASVRDHEWAEAHGRAQRGAEKAGHQYDDWR